MSLLETPQVPIFVGVSHLSPSRSINDIHDSYAIESYDKTMITYQHTLLLKDHSVHYRNAFKVLINVSVLAPLSF